MSNRQLLVIVIGLSPFQVAGQSSCDCVGQTYEYFRDDFDGPEINKAVWAGSEYSPWHQMAQFNTAGLDYLVNPFQTTIPITTPDGGGASEPLIPDWTANYGFEQDPALGSGKLVMKTIQEPVFARCVDWYSDDTIVLGAENADAPNSEWPAKGPNRRNFEYRSAGLNSFWWFGYGIYRWRTKLPGQHGVYPSIWLYSSEQDNHGEEIDIIEYVSCDPHYNEMPANVHGEYADEYFASHDSADLRRIVALPENDLIHSRFLDYYLFWMPERTMDVILEPFGQATTFTFPASISFGLAEVNQTLTPDRIGGYSHPLDMKESMTMKLGMSIGGFVYAGSDPFCSGLQIVPPFGQENCTMEIDPSTFPFKYEIDHLAVSTPINCNEVSVCDYSVVNDNKSMPVINGKKVTLGGDGCSFTVRKEFFASGGHGRNLDAIACEAVIMKDGFHAERGSHFHARTTNGPSSGKKEDWADAALSAFNAYTRNATIAKDSPSNTVVHDANGSQIPTKAKSIIVPNPTTGLITYNGMAPLGSATVMDLTGRTMHTVSLSGVEGPVNIDLSPYRPGTYLLRVQYQSGKVEVHRVVRQ